MIIVNPGKDLVVFVAASCPKCAVLRLGIALPRQTRLLAFARGSEDRAESGETQLVAKWNADDNGERWL